MVITKQCDDCEAHPVKRGEYTRRMSREEVCPFIRWDVVDRDAHLGSVKDELEYYKGALQAVERKLSNPKFMELASDKVVALNKKRRQRIKEKIAELEGQ